MLRREAPARRPQRWDVPFGDNMSARDVDHLLALPPFSQMQSDRFPASCPLRGILQNDARLVGYQPGDLVIREGDYGHSAFLLLRGTVRVTLQSLPEEILGRAPRAPLFSWQKLWRLLRRSSFPEVRRHGSQFSNQLGQRDDGPNARIFLQDVPGILQRHRTLTLGAGQIFGELAALSRTPRSATVFAETEVLLLEVRWQGLRDLMRYDDAIRSHIAELYRNNSLAAHLRETPFLKQLDKTQLQAIVKAAEFETFGDFEWNRPFQSLREASPSERISAEPVIANEGNAANGLILIRNGFARLSQRRGHGHCTRSYLGKGQLFGLEELWRQWKTGRTVPLRHSLRAVGYVDIIRIPTDLVETHVLPQLSQQQLALIQKEWTTIATDGNQATDDMRHECATDAATAGRAGGTGPADSRRNPQLETSMLEFLVEQRLINGSQAMIINLDRCTRCDDCVRACSATHDNNPRFVRSGPTFQHQMFASACMHCEDPVCMIGCPTGAISRERRTGSVTIHDSTCIGCSTCANSCPYQAIRMVEIRDEQGRLYVDQTARLPLMKATKCDLCTDHWGGPACQQACPHDALVRIDLRRPDDLAAWLAR